MIPASLTRFRSDKALQEVMAVGALEVAALTEGLILDPVYAATTLGGLIGEIETQRANGLRWPLAGNELVGLT